MAASAFTTSFRWRVGSRSGPKRCRITIATRQVNHMAPVPSGGVYEPEEPQASAVGRARVGDGESRAHPLLFELVLKRFQERRDVGEGVEGADPAEDQDRVAGAHRHESLGAEAGGAWRYPAARIGQVGLQPRVLI